MEIIHRSTLIAHRARNVDNYLRDQTRFQFIPRTITSKLREKKTRENIEDVTTNHTRTKSQFCSIHCGEHRADRYRLRSNTRFRRNHRALSRLTLALARSIRALPVKGFKRRSSISLTRSKRGKNSVSRFALRKRRSLSRLESAAGVKLRYRVCSLARSYALPSSLSCTPLFFHLLLRGISANFCLAYFALSYYRKAVGGPCARGSTLERDSCPRPLLARRRRRLVATASSSSSSMPCH